MLLVYYLVTISSSVCSYIFFLYPQSHNVIINHLVLQFLSLSGGRLTSLPKDAFAGLHLTTLLLNGNQFTHVPDLQVLGNTLRVLNMNQNPIQELDETSFIGLPRLSEVMVSGMPKLYKVNSGTFSNLESLKVISCTYNPTLVDIDEDAFWKLDLKRTFLQEV